jgi:hypothetical protein
MVTRGTPLEPPSAADEEALVLHIETKMLRRIAVHIRRLRLLLIRARIGTARDQTEAAEAPR